MADLCNFADDQGCIRLSARPEEYDYLHYLELKPDGTFCLCAGSGQCIDGEFEGTYEWASWTALVLTYAGLKAPLKKRINVRIRRIPRIHQCGYGVRLASDYVITLSDSPFNLGKLARHWRHIFGDERVFYADLDLREVENNKEEQHS